MFSRAQVEQVLKVNGVAPTATDEQIKSVLLSARWNASDVDTAVIILRENINTHETNTESLHKKFRTDTNLSPTDISHLLGIELNISAEDLRLRHKRYCGTAVTWGQLLSIIISATILAMIIIVGMMWYVDVDFLSLLNR